jgi:hypothetical protein
LLDSFEVEKNIADTLAKLNRHKLLILRLVKNDCGACIDSTFSNTVRVAKLIGAENVVILLGGYELNNFYKYKRIYQYDLPNFLFAPQSVTDTDDQHLSYYFCVSKNTKYAHLVFFTEPRLYPVPSKKYLKTIVANF